MMTIVRSRRAMVARHLSVQRGENSRKAYTGDNPISGAEWKRARNSFGYTQAVFGHYFSTHPNTVAKRERGEQDFPHPRLARLAIEQHRIDINNQDMSYYNFNPIRGAEWQAYLDGLGMTLEQFGAEIDAHPITVSKRLMDEVEFPHPNMARLAVRRIYDLKDIPLRGLNI